jgi:hypothetical protein
MANGRCRIHGGATPAGVASPHFRTGRHSRYLKDLPRDLRAGYKASLNDPERTCLADELALLESRIGQLLRRLSGAAAPPWAEVLRTLDDLTAATTGGNAGAFRLAFDQHSRVVRAGAEAAGAQADVWQELMDAIALKTKTASAEARRLHELRAFVPVEFALTLVAAVTAAAKDAVRDADDLRRLQRNLITILPPAEGEA